MKQVQAKILGLLALAAFGAPAAYSAEKVQMGYYSSDTPLAAEIAQDQGFFEKHGIDADMTLEGGSSVTTPAALAGNSYQIGMATMPTILLAKQSGIDLRIIAATVVTAPGYHLAAVVARPDLNVKTAKDLEGKTIGVPGINNFLHVLLVNWLDNNNVDVSKVHFAESDMPRMDDLLHAHQIDAALPAEPFLTRILQDGNGSLVSYFTDDLPPGTLTFTWIVTGDYAKAHPDVIKGFRAAVNDGLAYYHAHPDTRAPTLSKFSKVPVAILEKTPAPPYDNTINVSRTAFWVDVMTKQKLLTAPIDPASLLVH